MKKIIMLSLLVLGATLVSGQDGALAQGGPELEAGRIETVDYAQNRVYMSDGYIERGNSQLPLRSGGVQFLYSGDKIYVLVPYLKVEYAVVGSDEIKFVTSENSPQSIPDSKGLRPNTCVLLSCGLVRDWLLGAQWSALPRVTRAHAAERNPIVSSPLLSDPAQFLTSTGKNIAVVWSGGVGSVRFSRKATRSERRFANMSGPFPAAFNLMVVGDDGGQATWRVTKTAAAPPLPDGVAPDAVVTSDGDRLERALFLLQPKYAQWHLFAISEIADLHDHSFAADLIWRQIVNGTKVQKNP